MTVFIISQRVSAIRNADHILVMDDGRPAGYGTHQELLRSNQVYQEICASQSAGKEARCKCLKQKKTTKIYRP